MPQGAAPYGAAQCWTHGARTLGSCTASLLSRSLDARRRMVQRSAGRMVQRGDGREPSCSSKHLKRMADPAYWLHAIILQLATALQRGVGRMGAVLGIGYTLLQLAKAPHRLGRVHS